MDFFHYNIEIANITGLKEKLLKKEEEYEQRIKHPKNAIYKTDALYKKCLLEMLRERGYRFNTNVAAIKIKQELGYLDYCMFQNACNVIASYAMNWTGILIGGTGLPE